MTREDCLHCLIKAISCYVQKDCRSWAYLYECAYDYLTYVNAENYITILNVDLVRLVKYSKKVPSFLHKYVCDLQNALLGYEHVTKEEFWITQFEILLGVTIDSKRFTYGYACLGKEIKFNIIYSLER